MSIKKENKAVSSHFSKQGNARLEDFSVTTLVDYNCFLQSNPHGIINFIDEAVLASKNGQRHKEPRFDLVLNKNLSNAVRALTEKVSDLKRREICRVFNSMEAQKLIWDRALVDKITEQSSRLIKENINFSVRQSMSLLGSFSMLNICPPLGFLRSLEKIILSGLNEIAEPRSLVKCIRSCAILKLRGINFDFSPILESAQKHLLDCKFNSFNYIDRSQLYDSQVILGLPIFFNRIASLENPSRLEEEFICCLKSAGASRISDIEYVDTMKHNIDLAINWKNRNIFMEIDGPSHYIFEAKEDGFVVFAFDGGTIMQSALLRKALPQGTIVRVDYKDFNMIRDDQNKVCAFLDKCVAMPNGVYQTKPNDFGLAISNILPDSKVHEQREFAPVVLEDHMKNEI